jgi:hypothetical protein
MEDKLVDSRIILKLILEEQILKLQTSLNTLTQCFLSTLINSWVPQNREFLDHRNKYYHFKSILQNVDDLI